MMAALAFGVFGVVGYNRLALDLLPDISYPSLTIQTEFANAAPAEVENLITRPIEEVVGVLKGLRTIHSVSRAGISDVALEFEWDSDMDFLALDVREKLDRLFLPDEAEEPIVLRFDPSQDPIIRVALWGGDDLRVMRRVADRRIKQELETVTGVAAAQVKGGLEEEIQVEIDQEKLAALGIPLERVRAVLAGSNINLPGGALEDEESQYLIRTVNEYDSMDEIADLVFHTNESASVRIGDVGQVVWGTKERREITRVNNSESVEIDIYKEGDANIVSTARNVRAQVEELNQQLPEGLLLVLLFDQSRFIERALREVRATAVAGGLFAILVLYAFLRSMRTTLIIAVSIPLSILVTFMALYRLDISLNIMSLGGLTLGIGMLVDSSIVVLESIHRRRHEGASDLDAAVDGTAEVGGAVAASTLTTIAVFLPIVFVEGIAGQLFGDMAITVTLSLLASLFVAITLIPMLSTVGKTDASGTTLGQERRAPDKKQQEGSLGRFSSYYDRILRSALKRRARTLSLAAFTLVLSVLFMQFVDSELLPDISEGEFFFEATLPEGVPLAATDRTLLEMERRTSQEAAVSRHYTTVGSRVVAGGLSLRTKAEHIGQLNIVLRNRRDEAGEEALAQRLRATFESIPDLVVRHGKPTYFSLKTPIEMIMYGEDQSVLRDFSRTLEGLLRMVPGLTDIRSSLEEGAPEIQIVFNRARLAGLGVDMREMSETVRARLEGTIPSRFKDDDRQIDIRLRNRMTDRESLADLANLVIPGPDGTPLRLVTVADISVDRGPAEIHRNKQQRAALVTANLQDRSLSDVVHDLERLVDETAIPAGVSVELGGQHEEMEVSFASLRFALALAIFLVYLVMAATFESLLHPFIVFFAIPLALVGVCGGLIATGTTLSVIAFLGMVMLAGIVVNNAIVLIVKVNQLRRAGLEKAKAVIWACHVRLRPILMTTLTTVLGLAPMALAGGEGSELRAPLAITVSFGLVFSTALTLIVIPVLYMSIPSRVGGESE
jgi:HAE1 family hydrophobic/amphiphilic exporter-1